MIVWGGVDDEGNRIATRGRYDPGNDSWQILATNNAPTARFGHTAVWTGTYMLVWGGDDVELPAAGARYRLSNNQWSAMATGAPAGRVDHTAVWTGNRMVVWGGWNDGYLESGGRYDPAANAWERLQSARCWVLQRGCSGQRSELDLVRRHLVGQPDDFQVIVRPVPLD